MTFFDSSECLFPPRSEAPLEPMLTRTAALDDESKPKKLKVKKFEEPELEAPVAPEPPEPVVPKKLKAKTPKAKKGK